MATNSKIEWTDHTSMPRSRSCKNLRMWMFLSPALGDRNWLQVPSLMARLAKRYAISHIKTAVDVLREAFNVVSLQVAAACIAAVLAHKAVASEYSQPPVGVLDASARIFISLVFSVSVGVMILSAWGVLPPVFSQLQANGLASRHTPERAGASVFGLAHLLLCFFSMFVAEKCRYTALGRFLLFNSCAIMTPRAKAVAAASIYIESRHRLPITAIPAPFFTATKPQHVFVNSHSDPVDENLDCASSGLCHCVSERVRTKGIIRTSDFTTKER